MDPELVSAQRFVYEPHGFVISQFSRASESREYGACSFVMNQQRIEFRTAKITPTKMGQFVTLWKRMNAGPIQPYDRKDEVDLFVISVRTPEHFGQFVFPKAVLEEKGIISHEGKGGKRAIRVYPPWDKTDSRQAQNTQKWQLVYFWELDENKPLDSTRIQHLFSYIQEKA